ncbi:Cellobiose+2-epimerase [Methylocapsa aurea]|uniref:AGE family epimerase/isomerase n=1 Tax=Methylocapsa aurea TaxID=663610 RepID=UPI003D18A145
MTATTRNGATLIRDWAMHKALPLWASNGWDAEADAFVERLTLEGAPLLDAPRRAMVQARQIVVYSVAHRRRWLPKAGEIVARAATMLVKRYFEADGHPGWVYSVARDGAVIDARRDLYAHAFILLGLAKAYDVTGDHAYIAHAEHTMAFLDAHMASPHGGYLEMLPGSGGPRRQNPHMHLFEALLALYEATLNCAFLERAGSLRNLLHDRFLQANGSILVEFFNDAWHPLDGPDFPFEPGHHFEWAWLLRCHDGFTGREPSREAAMLWETALRAGVDADGRISARATTGGSVDRSTRLWTYAEAAKAAFYMAHEAPHHARHRPGFFFDAMYERFLSPAVAGSWIDEFDADNARKVDYAPASSFYHICCAVDVVEGDAKGVGRSKSYEHIAT